MHGDVEPHLWFNDMFFLLRHDAALLIYVTYDGACPSPCRHGYSAFDCSN